MSGSIRRVLTIARREFLATIRRKAFLFTVLGTPAYFAFVMFFAIGGGARDRVKVLREFTTLGVVDSSGMFAHADRRILTRAATDANPFARDARVETFHTDVRFIRDWPTAERELRDGRISQVLVVPGDYVEHGDLRRYARTSSLFSSADRRVITGWLARGLVQGRVDPEVGHRVARPAESLDLYTLNRSGEFVLKDDRHELVDFLLPMAFGLILGLTITVGGQYLLQGVSEEKESRILESLLCTVSSEELLGGKLLGLGAAGLLLVALWSAFLIPVYGSASTLLDLHLPAGLLLFALLYFLFGYLFYASLMTGIGGMTNNMREAQQFAVWFSFANFVPFIMLERVLSAPNGPLATGLSLFPPTAATAMMLRLTAPSNAVPGWQLGLSLALLVAAGLLTLIAAARVFRIGMLLYGKTPNLPEIVRWARRG